MKECIGALAAAASMLVASAAFARHEKSVPYSTEGATPLYAHLARALERARTKRDPFPKAPDASAAGSTAECQWLVRGRCTEMWSAVSHWRVCLDHGVYGSNSRSRDRAITVAVGTTIGGRPPHRSVQARLRIRLLSWMSGGKAGIRIRMQNTGVRNPPGQERAETIPSHLSALTATDQNAPPQSANATIKDA